MQKEIVSSLRRFGLKDKDIKVFVACLKHGDGIYVHEIVKLTGLNRSTVDVIIDRLLPQGYLVKAKEGRRNRFFAASPKTIHEKQQTAADDFFRLLPMLEKFSDTLLTSDVQVYQGPEGIQNLYNSFYTSQKLLNPDRREVLNISSLNDIIKSVPNFRKLVRKRIQLRIPVKIIRPWQNSKDSLWQSDPKEYRWVRFFDGTLYPFNINLDVYGDRVNIFSPVPPVSGMLIHNPRIAQSMRSLFYLIWNQLPQKQGQPPEDLSSENRM